MHLDEIRLAIRPRNILECLDLAFLFWGRHFLGLTIAAALALFPVIWLHLVWLAPSEDPYNFLLYACMEAPWVTLPITIYLGQITFSQRFSIKKAFHTFFAPRVFISLFLFLVLLRFICLITIVLFPMVLFGMYYLNPIILLEQPSITQVWSRRSAMNSRTLPRILAFVVTDFCILVAGFYFLSQLFRGISSLWDGHYTFKLSTSPPEEWWTLVGWEELLAFWLTMCFIAVFRFITYLDCRIRREGWDVELKLRAEASHFAHRESA